MTRIQKRSRKRSQEKASASALNSGPASPFEFSVTSEEGINLFVDMNLSSVDWHKRLANGVCVCRCIEENKFQSFREELLYLGNNRKQKKDSFWKSNSRIKDGDASICSSVKSFNEVSDNSLLNHPDANKGPLEIFAAEACSFAHEESEHLKQQRDFPVSISYSSGVKDINSSPRPEDMKSMDPNAFHVPHGKIASCSMGSLVADGPQTTWNDKSMTLLDEVSMNLKINKGQNPQNVMSFPGFSVISATESKFSEVGCPENDTACSSFVNDPLLNLIEISHSRETGLEELTNSVEIENHAHLNIISAENQATGSPINQTKASCKSEKETEKFMSDGGRKRKSYNSQSDKVSVQFSGRVLRSAVRPRRSHRLVSKGVTPF